MTIPLPAERPHSVAIALAAGSGVRAGGDTPKQFRSFNGRPLLFWSLSALLDHVDDVLLVVAPGAEEATRNVLGDLAHRITLVTGGETRRQSVRNALDYLDEQPARPDYVLVHDTARPGLTDSVLDRLRAALDDGAAGAMPVLPVADTLVRAGDSHAGDVVDRAALRRVQTPQAFRFTALLNAHRNWQGNEEPTDDAQMVRATGASILLVDGDARLEKVTFSGDHERLEMLLNPAPQLIGRTGLGFDVHRLEPGVPLWLCGVNIPHSHGLSGHSDADVALHALVDAILGTLAEGDIGSHFPPSDPQWRGASSDRFLAFAVERVAARGGIIDHLDVAIICEAPKIGPHREAMRARLAQITGLEINAISVKATTTERLGLTGRGEGIAAQALVSIRLP